MFSLRTVSDTKLLFILFESGVLKRTNCVNHIHGNHCDAFQIISWFIMCNDNLFEHGSDICCRFHSSLLWYVRDSDKNRGRRPRILS